MSAINYLNITADNLYIYILSVFLNGNVLFVEDNIRNQVANSRVHKQMQKINNPIGDFENSIDDIYTLLTFADKFILIQTHMINHQSLFHLYFLKIKLTIKITNIAVIFKLNSLVLLY